MAASRSITVNGLKLHHLDHGGRDNRWLVCIHGLTGNAHNFDALAPHLTPGYHVLSLDVRGRGDSEWGPGIDYTPQNYVADLLGVLDALGIERTTLIGTSMGGMISILFAGGYPERVENVVLNDIGPDIDATGLARIASYVGEAPSEFDDLEAVAAYYRKIYPPAGKMADEAVREMARWSVKPAPNGKLGWKMDPQIRRPVRGGVAARPLDLWTPFARITAPVLIVRGGESDILSAATVARMKSTLRGAKSVEVPDVGHAPSLVEPEALAAIKEFLSV